MVAGVPDFVGVALWDSAEVGDTVTDGVPVPVLVEDTVGVPVTDGNGVADGVPEGGRESEC